METEKKRKPLLIVVLGPTAVGKTELSIELAKRLGGEIISADSRLFYRGMDIGTAKPSISQRRVVPHHLIDIADPTDTWSLARFQAEAHRLIADISAHAGLPLLVGGTGQYIRAVTQGWHPPPVQPDGRLRTILEHWATEITADGLHQRLAVVDPLAAQRIDPRNQRRTVRALEVIFTTGQRFSTQLLIKPSPYRLAQLGLFRPRVELYQRIDERIKSMLSAGLVDEVQGLLVKGFSPDLPSFSAIGYRQTIAYLMGNISLEDAVSQIKRQTRIFVRRQANWFKMDDPDIHWFRAGDADVVDQMLKQLRVLMQ